MVGSVHVCLDTSSHPLLEVRTAVLLSEYWSSLLVLKVAVVVVDVPGCSDAVSHSHLGGRAWLSPHPAMSMFAMTLVVTSSWHSLSLKL